MDMHLGCAGRGGPRDRIARPSRGEASVEGGRASRTPQPKRGADASTVCPGSGARGTANTNNVVEVEYCNEGWLVPARGPGPLSDAVPNKHATRLSLPSGAFHTMPSECKPVQTEAVRKGRGGVPRAARAPAKAAMSGTRHQSVLSSPPAGCNADGGNCTIPAAPPGEISARFRAKRFLSLQVGWRGFAGVRGASPSSSLLLRNGPLALSMAALPDPAGCP